MLNQLKKYFPSLMPYTGQYPDGYLWFIMDNHKIVGIHEKDISEKDIILLTTFLNTYHPNIPEFNYEAKKWQQRIHESSDEITKEFFRFIYFLMPENQIDPKAFQEALNELFQKEIPILWLNETEGLLVETFTLIESKVDYNQIIQILSADLSVNIRFYVGGIEHTYRELKTYYDNLLSQAYIVFSLTKKEVVYYAESIKYLLLYPLSTKEKEYIVTSILKEFKKDPEMLKTLSVFLDSNLNISETAKKLYMHRNSVQYRIDKYINETGINIQRFDEAISVKIALLAESK